jgi:hypothetical protein
MSYSVQLFNKKVKDQQKSYGKADFFENEANFDGFSSEQRQSIEARLIRYSFVLENEKENHMLFSYKHDPTVSALLTDSGLYFSASGDGIFEIMMTASEFTDTGEFLKYDPQTGVWEDAII